MGKNKYVPSRLNNGKQETKPKKNMVDLDADDVDEAAVGLVGGGIISSPYEAVEDEPKEDAPPVSTIRPYEELSRRHRNMIRIRKVKRGKKLKWEPLVAAVVLFAAFFASDHIPVSKAKPVVQPSENSAISMSFVGDVMLGRYVKEAYGSNYSKVFDDVRGIYETADLSFANVEFVAEQNPKQRLTKLPTLITGFNAIDALAQNGIDVFSMANNHQYDLGAKGVAGMIDYLQRNNYAYSGLAPNSLEKKQYTMVEANGRKIGFISVTDVHNAVDTATETGAGVYSATDNSYMEMVSDAAEECDLVVVYMHWGEEDQSGVIDAQKTTGRNLIDAGADIVIGSHPHVLQPVETYKDGIIFYSLGNFIFDQGNTFSKDSVLVTYELDEAGSGHFVLYPCRIKDGCPYVTDNKFYITRIYDRLTKMLPKDTYSKNEDGYLVIDAVDRTFVDADDAMDIDNAVNTDNENLTNTIQLP